MTSRGPLKTAGERRVPHARAIVAAAALLACAALLFLSRTSTWYFDEWTFIQTAPDWGLYHYLHPHNEHPSMSFRLVYSTLLHTVGLSSYLPYYAVLLMAHFANIALLFELIRRRSGDLIGIAAVALFMLLGAAWDDLLWAFQMAWLISVALGLGTLIALQVPGRRRTAIAAGLLLLSLTFSGIGLAFAVAAVVQLGLTAGRRRDLLWFVPVGVILLVWYVTYGRLGNHPNPQPTAMNFVLDPIYAAWGLSQSAGAVIGEVGNRYIDIPLLVAAVAVIAWRWYRHGIDGFVVGAASGLVAFYVITGLTRAQLGIYQAGSSRYVYIGAVFWLILLADAARGLPWRGTWRPALIACVFLAVFNSTVLLFEFATARAVLMQRQVADYYALAAMRDDPCLNPQGAVDLLVMPAETSPALYYRSLDLYGNPIDGAPLLDHASYAAGLTNLRRVGCVGP
ncbi:MAG TPA: hypothetical protein VM674_02440 [Candidatus Acidoferrum sp.]|nr:hypothetical protein [Candidatus Acidoferrum sp.]